MTIVTVTSKGRITLPEAACREVGIKPHDRVWVEVREGAIVIRPALELMDFSGTLGKALPRYGEIKRTNQALAERLKKAS